MIIHQITSIIQVSLLGGAANGDQTIFVEQKNNTFNLSTAGQKFEILNLLKIISFRNIQIFEYKKFEKRKRRRRRTEIFDTMYFSSKDILLLL